MATNGTEVTSGKVKDFLSKDVKIGGKTFKGKTVAIAAVCAILLLVGIIIMSRKKKA